MVLKLDVKAIVFFARLYHVKFTPLYLSIYHYFKRGSNLNFWLELEFFYQSARTGYRLTT